MPKDAPSKGLCESITSTFGACCLGYDQGTTKKKKRPKKSKINDLNERLRQLEVENARLNSGKHKTENARVSWALPDEGDDKPKGCSVDGGATQSAARAVNSEEASSPAQKKSPRLSTFRLPHFRK